MFIILTNWEVYSLDEITYAAGQGNRSALRWLCEMGLLENLE